MQKVRTPLPHLPYSTDNPFFLSFWTCHFLTFFDVRSLQNNFACFFDFSKRYQAEIRFEILILTSLVSKGVKRKININERLAEQIALLLQNSYITDGNRWLLPSFYRQLSLFYDFSKISSPRKLRGRHTMLLKVNNKDTTYQSNHSKVFNINFEPISQPWHFLCWVWISKSPLDSCFLWYGVIINFFSFSFFFVVKRNINQYQVVKFILAIVGNLILKLHFNSTILRITCRIRKSSHKIFPIRKLKVRKYQ